MFCGNMRLNLIRIHVFVGYDHLIDWCSLIIMRVFFLPDFNSCAFLCGYIFCTFSRLCLLNLIHIQISESRHAKLLLLSLMLLFKCLTHKKPSVLYVGHRQSVQNQIRRRKTRRLITFSTVCLQKFLLKFE